MAGIEAFEEIFDKLPGILSYQYIKPCSVDSDGVITFVTATADHTFQLQVLRSHLSHRTADHVVRSASQAAEPTLVLAPYIGRKLAAKLTSGGVNYIDANGNCHIAAPQLFVHIEGRTTDRSGPERGLRSAGYQALFAYLAEPALLDAPLRTVATSAGVSRQPVADMRRRLVDEGYVLQTKSRSRWHPQRHRDALALWLHGYELVVRPTLVRGSYRTRDKDPADLERRLIEALDEEPTDFRWGGCAAGFRITGHYRGSRTVVHLRSPLIPLQQQVGALADPRGNLVLMDAFGTLNWDDKTSPGRASKAQRKTVHPLLVYSEMLNEDSERAREAAFELYEIDLLPHWDLDQ